MKNTDDNTIFERYLTENEERQLFKAVDQYADIYARRDAAWMRLLRHTGIRIGTLAQLTVNDAQQAIRTKRLVLRDEICKRNNGYTVHANTTALKALRKLLKIRQEMGLNNIPAYPLVMTRNHLPMSIRSYQDRINKWRELAGLTIMVTPHFFRHTAAQRILERSTAANPLLVVKAALGHQHINSTAFYLKPNREQIANDMEAIS